MLIERLEIENFRALRSVDLDMRRGTESNSPALVALLGRNGGGKSSILNALDVFYDISAKVTQNDCYAHASNAEIVIRVTYGDLREEEKKEFQPYLQDDRLIVTKRFQITEKACVQKYYAAARQIPQFAELRRLTKREMVAGFKALVAENRLEGLSGAPRSADDAEVLMAAYEAGHDELLQTVEREEQFFGPKEIGGGKLDKFTKFVFVPAVRNATDEEQKKGVIYELINTIVLRQVNRRPDVQSLKDEMKSRITEVFSPENLTELGVLGSSISTLLERYSPGSALKLSWGEPVVPDIPLPKAQADLIEDDFPCPITHAGHGLQRSLILTLLQYLATSERPDETSDSPTSDDENVESESSASEVTAPDLILAIEEPELYLHPARCRYLSSLLLSLSRFPTDSDLPRNQVIYATHSPYFVDLERFDQIRIVRKPKDDNSPAPHSVFSQYTLDAAAKELARIADGDPSKFTRESFRARALPVLTTTVSEGFFSGCVVVVEGSSDSAALWAIQSILKEEWSALGVVVVSANGKENIDRPVVVFRGLGIPTYFLFDGDVRHKGGAAKKEQQTADRNIRYQRLAGVGPDRFPGTTITADWAVLEDCLETTLKDAVGVQFEVLGQAVAEELKYDSVSDVTKNADGMARFIEAIYDSGLGIPKLEEIVRAVTALARPTRSKETATDSAA